MTSVRKQSEKAIVIGGSVSGLLAARVLSDHFEKVCVIERDALPAGPEARKGVPQSLHLHGFLAGGVSALAALFPDFLPGVQERGGQLHDVARLGTWFMAGVELPQFDSGLRGLLMSRLALEAYLREQVRARWNVTFCECQRVVGLLGDQRRIAGVRVEFLDNPRTTHELRADLVIDASGRGSRATHWLSELGVEAPPEQTVRAHLSNTTCTIRRRPEHLGGAPAFIYSPAPPGLMAGAALAIEGDRYIIGLTTYLNAPVPKTYAEMIAFARALPVRGLDRLLEDAEPASEPVQFHERESRRRHFEAVARFPRGMLVMGDALCSFNPAYAQGVTVAAQQAQLLDGWLRRDMSGGERAFFRDAARVVEVPWSTIVAGDLQWPGVEGKRSPEAALTTWLFQRIVRASRHDRACAHALFSVLQMAAPPSAMFSPRVLWGMVRHGGAPAQLPWPEPPGQWPVPAAAASSPL